MFLQREAPALAVVDGRGAVVRGAARAQRFTARRRHGREGAFMKELPMASASRVSRSIRRWSSLFALPSLVGLALAACGGKVIVEGDGSGGGGGGAGGGTTSSGSVLPSTGAVPQSVCDAGVEHLNSCTDGGVGIVDPLPPCEGAFLCQMQCILGTSCGILSGTDTSDQEGILKFSNCVNACSN